MGGDAVSAHRGRTLGLHEARQTATARAQHRLVRGAEGEAQREMEIAALPSKDWRGHAVYRMWCGGDFGNGPHEVWLPARVLWSLIDLGHYRCAFH